MGFSSFINKAINLTTGGNNFLGTSRGIFGQQKGLFEGSTNPSTGVAYTPKEITTANLFQNLSTEQQKDLLLNNPNIYTPEGSQTYDPLTNAITLGESDFTKGERIRQEGLQSQLSSSLSGNLPSSNEEIQNATFNRGRSLIDPIVKQQRRDLAQQLADQGLPPGSEGFNEQMNRLDDSIARQYTDLSQASIATAEAQRTQRFNEIASLLGRSQVGSGASFGQNNAQFSGLDLFGAEQSSLNRQFQADQARKDRSVAQSTALIGALGSLGGAAVGAFASDITLKENIEQVGKSSSGIPIYHFEYKNKNFGEGRFEGVMAQDLELIKPEAIITADEGYKMVNYSLIDVNFRRVQ